MIIARRKLSTSLQRSLETFATRAQKAAALKGEVAILLTDNTEIQQLNRDFRGKNKPTDVLSFPSDANGMAGDIAISLDIAEENGNSLGHGTLTELQVLVLHGMLHLAGHDHENDDGEMASLEQKLREKLGLEHGLIERVHAASKQTPPMRRKRAHAGRQRKRT
ncbi:MAG TPA: rRNA maturation RNase YbeY [Terriglobales bacterium]